MTAFAPDVGRHCREVQNENLHASRFTFFLALLVFLLATGWAPVPRPAFQEEDVTEDPSVILVTQLYIFMTRAGERLQVEEYYLLSKQHRGPDLCGRERS